MAHVAAIFYEPLLLLVLPSISAVVGDIAACAKQPPPGIAALSFAAVIRLDAVNFQRISTRAAFGFR
jgi:hypothetical protein